MILCALALGSRSRAHCGQKCSRLRSPPPQKNAELLWIGHTLTSYFIVPNTSNTLKAPTIRNAPEAMPKAIETIQVILVHQSFFLDHIRGHSEFSTIMLFAKSPGRARTQNWI